MDDLIPILNKLQDVLSTIGYDNGLDLPQIVVIGSQSSGKSSCLEQIVGKEIFPKGHGIVTRRPLILQLQHIPPNSANKNSEYSEFGEFLHLPNRVFPHFDEIKKEIERETARVAGTHKGISKLPIHLKIHSPNVVNLTLVDLPGITKIPIGDQPIDIELQTRNLIMEYISKPNSLILAVSAANVDIVNSDSLKLAREVDPEGKRTIGVLTKIDLMDAGTNALDILTGRSYPLKLGWVGVINRSQQDLQQHKPLDDARAKENEFFRTHPVYRCVAAKCGTSYLSKLLNSILMQHIRDKLPELKARLNILISQMQQELLSYGDPAFTGKAHRGSLILRLLTKYASDFTAAIDGTNPSNPTMALSGGARLYYIFNNVFGSTLDSISPTGNLSTSDIRTAIRNSTGPRPSLFVPEAAFDLLVKPQIARLETPSLKCVDLVLDELLKISSENCSKELQRFPRLKDKIVEVMIEVLRERYTPTATYVESLVSIQKAYINTNHPGGTAISMLEKKFERRRREQEKMKKTINTSANTDSPNNSTSKPISLKDIQFPTNPNNLNNITMQSVSSKESFLTYFFGGSKDRDKERPLSANISEFRSRSPADKDGLHGMGTSSGSIASNVQENSQASEREEFEAQLIRSLITSYFNIVRKTLQDLVPKAVMHLLVNYCKESIQNRLVQTLYKEELFSELLMEDPEVAAERAKCKAMLDVYKRAHQIVSETY
ncbi:dynamin-related protein [Paraphysoderma sedebokerense]|nr:dynamin-related protein [Paraphysoderma sedebokerense]